MGKGEKIVIKIPKTTRKLQENLSTKERYFFTERQRKRRDVKAEARRKEKRGFGDLCKSRRANRREEGKRKYA